jgi:hypothetical protein
VFGFLGLDGLPTAWFIFARRAQHFGDRGLKAYSLANVSMQGLIARCVEFVRPLVADPPTT